MKVKWQLILDGQVAAEAAEGEHGAMFHAAMLECQREDQKWESVIVRNLHDAKAGGPVDIEFKREGQ
jgi:hypothetical protein